MDKLRETKSTRFSITIYRVLSNFLAWKVVEPLVTRLGEEFRASYLKFYSVVSGVKILAPRAESCVDVVNGHFPDAIGSLYVTNFFRKEAKEEVMSFVSHHSKKDVFMIPY